jgi:hypothetical protein
MVSDPNDSLSPNYLEFCAKVRSSDPSILSNADMPFKIRPLSEKEDIELANALLVNTNVTCLELNSAKYTKSSAEAMAKYVRTSKHLQRIEVRQHHEQMLCYFLPTLQESTSLKKLKINFPLIGEPSNLLFENMLTHTHSLQSLSLSCPDGLLEDLAVAAISSGLEKNTTLALELTLHLTRGASTIPPILTSLRDQPSMGVWWIDGTSAPAFVRPI